jgi:hypothetical protein
LAAGEIGFETDTNQFKIGDGVNAWSDLSYFKNLEDLGGSLDDYVPVALVGEPEGVASLDATGKIPSSQIPALVGLDSEITSAVSTAVSNLVDGAPEALNTLNEIATLIGDGSTLGASIVASLGELDTAIANHADATTGVHGISNVADLATHTYVATAVSTHASDTTNVHGVTDFAALATSDALGAAIVAHAAETTSVHGIDDTSELATKTYANDAVSAHQSDSTNVHGIADTSALALSADVTSAISTHNSDTTSVHGITDTANLVYTADSRLSDERIPSAGSVTAAKIATDAVETAKIKDLNVTSAKLAADSVATAKIENSAVTEAKIADGAVSTAKIASGAVTKSMVGLVNVDNTSDANKPVSTATQTALDAKASLSGATFTGDVTVETNLTIDGDLTVTGTTTTVNATDLVVTDPLIYIGEGNTGNLVDLGLVSSFNDGTYQHAGIVRDSSAGTWKLFKGVTDEPTTTVNFTQGSLDDLAVAGLTATTVTPSSGIVFSDGTQVKAGVPSITTFATAISSSATLASGEQDKFVPLTGAVQITLPATGYSTGQSIDFYQASGTGASFASTNSVVGTPGLKFRTTNSVVTAMKTSSGWLVFGDLSA